MTGSLMTAKDAQALAWSIHNSAANRAKASGACWQCCAEEGMRATDDAGMNPRVFQELMHAECAKRIELNILATHLT